MIRDALKGKKANPKTISLIMVYTLSSALSISPLEVYKMPVSLVKDLLNVHSTIEQLKAEEIDKAKRSAKGV
jgi:hypothetical protein|tara:strand:+ start:177 stop:392 length:216 start_codon:yes stop_codon:yes gene_type:complete